MIRRAYWRCQTFIHNGDYSFVPGAGRMGKATLRGMIKTWIRFLPKVTSVDCAIVIIPLLRGLLW